MIAILGWIDLFSMAFVVVLAIAFGFWGVRLLFAKKKMPPKWQSRTSAVLLIVCAAFCFFMFFSSLLSLPHRVSKASESSGGFMVVLLPWLLYGLCGILFLFVGRRQLKMHTKPLPGWMVISFAVVYICIAVLLTRYFIIDCWPLLTTDMRSEGYYWFWQERPKIIDTFPLVISTIA